MFRVVSTVRSVETIVVNCHALWRQHEQQFSRIKAQKMAGVLATESTLKGSQSHGCLECRALQALLLSTLVSIDVVETCGYVLTTTL